jgi:hypothetical protein
MMMVSMTKRITAKLITVLYMLNYCIG